MQVKCVRLYAKDDIRLEEFELPEIKDDEILVKVMSDSICMSTWKMVKQGADHKRVPADVADHPIIIGHEFAGDIVKVGKKWQDKFKPGQKFAQQPAIPGQAESPGYSYTECGGAATYCIFPNDIIEAGCLWTHEGDSYFESSVAEPMCCVICGYKTNYHVKDRYEHVMGTKAGGSIAILGGCGPMGLGAVSYALAIENKPAKVIVTDIDDAKLARANEVISVEEAKEKGVELIYVNTAKMDDPVDGLKALSVDGKGFDDVFVYVPARPVAELGNKILGYDGCMNLFAGPTDSEFSADVNLYDCHYNATKILGSTGGSIDDMKEAIDRAARKEIKPAVMITHVGGIDSIVDTTMNLPNIPGGKKLSYLHINMPMTAISDLRSLAKDDPFFNELADICDRHNGLWSAEAEKALLTHYGVE